MFITYILLFVGGVMIFKLKGRLSLVEQRLEWLEHERFRPEHAGALKELTEEPPAIADPEPVPAPLAVPEQMPLSVPVRPAPILEEETESGRDLDVDAPEEHVPHEAAAPRRSFSFEDLFGRRLPIWAGGVTLAIAGMLIVKYSIDLGLLSPLVRVINGLLFGFALIGAAEWARRKERWMRDVRVQQALAGAGIATLYGSILVAANIYELIGPFPALVGMASVTALAMALALRFGAPSALLGLVGGLAAPALVGSGDPNIPLLALYLALAVGGLCALSRSQRWAWLGVGALIGGFGWGGLLILGGRIDTVATLSIGAYLMLLGVLLPAFSFAGKNETRLRLGGSLVAAAQMAGLVATGGFALLHWGLFGLISIAIIWLSRRDAMLRLLPPVGLAIALLLLAAWPDPTVMPFAIAAIGMALIYGLPALQSLWGPQGRIVEAAQTSAIAFGAFLASMIHFYHLPELSDLPFALVAAGAALLPAGAAMLGLRTVARHEDWRFALLTSSAGLLFAAAAVLAVPGWSEGPAVAVIAAGLLAVRLSASDPRIEWTAWIIAGASLVLLLVQLPSLAELEHAFGENSEVSVGTALMRWATVGVIAAAFAWKARGVQGRLVAQSVAVLLLYCAAAQLLPALALPLLPAIAILAVAAWSRMLPPNVLLPVLATLFVLILGWAFIPLGQWSIFALESLAGSPMLAVDLPAWRTTATRLLIPASLIVLSLWQARDAIDRRSARLGSIGAALLGGAALHIVFKQLFALSDPAEFVAFGLAERCIWQALLLGGAALAWSNIQRSAWLRPLALGLCTAAIGHLAYYSLLLHNPLWVEQEVGSWPLLNLLPLVYALPFAAHWLLQRQEPQFAERYRRSLALAQMILLLLFSFSMLRQLFHGSLLVGGGVTDIEDILRSIVAILLALGFLIWGIARGARDWRIASLVVMLAAVAKVFLFDASDLEGLPRILSFVALGFSLIGIGWLYSRYLNAEPDEPAKVAGG
jgi:uncharacterized membrane protein